MPLITAVIVILTSQVSVVLLFYTTGVDASGDASSNATCDFTAWALDANCRNRDLDEIPHEYETSVSMDLRNNRLQVLKAGNFTGFSELRYLDLEFNIICEINSGAFRGCDSLLYLYLQFNSLESIEEGAFEGAASLERLFLNQNSIRQLHPDAFRGLGALTGLYIGHNEINQLPSGLFQHTPLLKYLHMGDNTLNDLSSETFADLSDLTYLNMMNNNLKVIESGTFDPLKNLEELDLSGNLLISINAFPTLPTLKILDVYDNKMQEIGSLSETVDGLDELYLGQNNLSCTCSMNPIREWIQQHKSDEAVDASKVILTCPSPPRLEGKVLDSILRQDLCPKAVGLGSVLPSTPKKSAVASSSRNGEEQDPHTFLFGGMSDAVIYVIVAGSTVSIIVLVLCILIRCLTWQTQRSQQQIQLREVKQHKTRQPQAIRRTDDRDSFKGEDENPYDYIRSQSPTHDSAFGSQDNLGNDDEVPPPPGQAYPESSTSSDSGILYSQEWRPFLPSPPTTQIPLLEREQHSTNPFLSDTLQDDHQAVTVPEGSILEDRLDSLSSGIVPYPQEWRQFHPSPPATQIPLLEREQHSTNPFLNDALQDGRQAVAVPAGSILEDVLDSLSSGNIPKYSIIKLDSRDPSTPRDQRQTPDTSAPVTQQQIQHEYFICPRGPTQHLGSVVKKPQYPYKKKGIKMPSNQKEDTKAKCKTQYRPLNQATYFEPVKSLDENQRKRTEPFQSNMNGNPFGV